NVAFPGRRVRHRVGVADIGHDIVERAARLVALAGNPVIDQVELTIDIAARIVRVVRRNRQRRAAIRAGGDARWNLERLDRDADVRDRRARRVWTAGLSATLAGHGAELRRVDGGAGKRAAVTRRVNRRGAFAGRIDAMHDRLGPDEQPLAGLA